MWILTQCVKKIKLDHDFLFVFQSQSQKTICQSIQELNDHGLNLRVQDDLHHHLWIIFFQTITEQHGLDSQIQSKTKKNNQELKLKSQTNKRF